MKYDYYPPMSSPFCQTIKSRKATKYEQRPKRERQQKIFALLDMMPIYISALPNNENGINVSHNRSTERACLCLCHGHEHNI